MKRPLRVSLGFFVVLLTLLSIFSFISAGNDSTLFYAKLIWSLVVSYLGLCIYRYGNISKYRSILFVLIAFFFFLEFKLFRFLSFADTIPPYCHIAQAPRLFNFIHHQFLAITSGEWQVWGVLTLGFLWLLIMLTIGQGICSWVCFFGGIDEAFTKLRKKPLIKLKISKRWRDFPLAFLIFLLIITFLQGRPVFCSWFCPFKLTTGFLDTAPAIRIAQIAFFLLFLVVFVILLPVLSKKRTFCSLICPFGALVSVCGKISPYRVTINKEKCEACGKCLEVCPVFAIERHDPDGYRISSYCNKCGKCIDVCPGNAIDISVCNKLVRVPFFEIRDIFVFLSLLITGVISGSFVPRVILQLMGLK
ncbi:MAG: 4Fe-4S binding protein [Candidatus Omnitrophica bacterium]|nr:4Fe-4S binding protein [Candidatus Omnitrophota bacterium]